MSGAQISLNGQIEPYAEKLTDTADHVIFTSSVEIQAMIVSVLASCDGTGTAFSLWIDTGGTSVYICNAKAVSANDIWQVRDHPLKLKPGWSLKCKAGTADHIDVTAALALLGKSSAAPSS